MDHPFSYEIIYSSRRTIAVQVTRDGRVVVRAPRRCSRAYIETFISKNEAWVLEHLEKAADGLKNRFGTGILQPASQLIDRKLSQIDPKNNHNIHPVGFF